MVILIFLPCRGLWTTANLCAIAKVSKSASLYNDANSSYAINVLDAIVKTHTWSGAQNILWLNRLHPLKLEIRQSYRMPVKLPRSRRMTIIHFISFQVLTQEDWNIVLFLGMQRTSHWAALYFVALMTFGNYVLFNLLVAILVEGFSSQVSSKRIISAFFVFQNCVTLVPP